MARRVRESDRPTKIGQAIRQCRPLLLPAAAFSAIVNLLALTPTIYMMQVYDRAIATGHLPTLVTISIVCLVGLAVLSLLDWLRARLLVRASVRLDDCLGAQLLDALLARPDLSRLDRAEGMRRLEVLRQALGGPMMLALFDLPWTPLYLVVAMLIHPLIGLLALVGGGILVALAVRNQSATRPRSQMASETGEAAQSAYGQISAYAAEVRAMGMGPALARRHLRERAVVKGAEADASFTASGYGAGIRFLRLALQSAALGLGAYLAIEGKISSGAVIAAGLLLGRALAPIDQIVSGWRGILGARDAHRRLTMLLDGDPLPPPTLLPAPTGAVSVERLTVLAPQSDRVALAQLSFAIEPGEQIGVIGASGAGKTTLMRALAGALLAVRGSIRYDDAPIEDWAPEQLTAAIGYLPQEFVLFPGSVRDNIARFEDELGLRSRDVIDGRVVAAAQQAGVHDMILRLPNGYNTPIGVGGMGLSAGQTQRIALARAFYGEPKILILDEPNAHLDADSTYRLIRLLSALRAKGTTVILAAHSGEVLASMDKLLVLNAGTIVSFGPLPGGSSSASRPRVAQEA